MKNDLNAGSSCVGQDGGKINVIEKKKTKTGGLQNE